MLKENSVVVVVVFFNEYMYDMNFISIVPAKEIISLEEIFLNKNKITDLICLINQGILL